MKSLRVTNIFRPVRSFEFYNCIGRPFGGLIGVALITGIGCTKLYGMIGPWYPDAVIPSVIDPHVCFMWHMTFNALGSLGACLMEVMIRRVEPGGVVFIGNMTTGAKLVGVSV